MSTWQLEFLPATAGLGEGAECLRGFAEAMVPGLVGAIAQIDRSAPFRHMVTPFGKPMSVAMTNCGQVGWISDQSGYRYDYRDPLSGLPWPPMPDLLLDLATTAASVAGFPGFVPDACLINRYAPGARITLHRDCDERDFNHPIVSVSLGLPAVFLWGGLKRSDRTRRLDLASGDVVVWGGPARLTYHAVKELAPGEHHLTGGYRFNLTFRRALLSLLLLPALLCAPARAPGNSAQGAANTESAALYEVTTELGMPHLEENLRYSITHEKRCLTREGLYHLFPILNHPALAGCRLGGKNMTFFQRVTAIPAGRCG
jgi:alkylated DNA repair protein (DNA oxidative demethylase)